MLKSHLQIHYSEQTGGNKKLLEAIYLRRGAKGEDGF